MDRRDFLRVCALLGLAGFIPGLSQAVAVPSAVKSGYVVINGWVLPAQHFQPAQT
ncbi:MULTISPECIES: twin-arginine translocation signal domain-containing protein [Pseudomonas]|uniref:twin-arginine translocation signal domain-containing protein n=1 Tax=Pseudomonas TaxID=286 RepID=UPI001A9343CD|nr:MULTISPECIES: twin-arginine translocation signal domain-containing protein [Pseudomonas]